MKILLILPQDMTYYYHGYFKKTLSYAPLTLTTLAALVPAYLNASIEIIDEGIQSLIISDMQYDVVGITCVTSSAPRAYELSALFRKKGSIVVLGGAHPTLNPLEAAQHADIVVAGYAETVWPEILLCIKSGQPFKKFYKNEKGLPLKTVLPARYLLPKRKYLGVPTVIASRGCTNKCSFCSIHHIWNNNPHHRPVHEVINEIKVLKTNKVLFLDPNIIVTREYAGELFKALIPLKIKWAGLSTIALAQDKTLFDLAVKSGCIGILTGFESWCQASIDQCGKDSFKVSSYKEVVNCFHDAGIRVLGCFVLGFDQDTPETIQHTLDFIDEIGIDIPRFSIMTPFPGTPLFEGLKKESRILTEDWSYYDTEHVVYIPKNMTPAELQNRVGKIWNEAYSIKRIAGRIMQIPQNRVLTAFINFGFRKYMRRIALDYTSRIPRGI
jgi:radical SAM superfamily enzyme YgiQ (UPF0313 family)